MSEIWNSTVNGLFKGGKIGKYAGAAAGALAALTIMNPVFAFENFFLGPIGAAAAMGVGGAVMGIVAGAAIGAVIGAVAGMVKSATDTSPARESAPQRSSNYAVNEPARGAEREQDMARGAEASTAFQDRVVQSRQSQDYSKYRGL
jgi:gas vesicle protein